MDIIKQLGVRCFFLFSFHLLFVTIYASKLWYTKPACERNVSNPWMEYQLPIGNGQLGAMIQGGVWKDEIQFNEKTLWTGSTTVRGAYQNFGYVKIEDLSPALSYTDYQLQLDLQKAVVTASWKKKGISYQREYIASYPSKCIAVHTTVGKGGELNLRFSLCGTHGEIVSYHYDEAMFGKQIDLLTDACCMKISQEGGVLSASDLGIEVRNANSVMAVLVAGTDYDITSPTYTSDTGMLGQKMQTIAKKVVNKGWDSLYEEHVKDYAYYYNKVSLDLGGESTLPTDQLIDNYQKSNVSLLRRQLEQLYFDYGRYLLISSSRGVTLPNNLQGIWCNSNTPSWTCDIHANINVQMNYWPAELMDLGDMHRVLLDYVYQEAMEQPQWRRYAREINGQTVGWSCFTGNNIFGFGSPGHSEDYNAVPAWYCWHLWQHFLYSNDEEFLETRALPPMIECMKFWMERLVVDPTDHLWVCPMEWSPEHGPTEDGTAHTQQCVWNLFDIFLQAVGRVGEERAGVSQYFVEQVRERFSRLDNGLHTESYTGKYGREYNDVKQGDLLLREWKYTTYDIGNVKDVSGAMERNHRHVSHLMCLYPFDMVTPTSEYFIPVINSMKLRGEQNTGWAMAWKLNLWARAGDGNKAYEILTTALQHARTYNVSTDPWNSGVYYNLLDAHPPFQIDGNFGVIAGMAEMLLQSYGGVLQLLPALPDVWKSGGYVRGLRAVGNYGIDIEWNENGLQVDIHSDGGSPCHVKYPHIAQAILTDEDGHSQDYQVISPDMISFSTEKGRTYSLSIDTMNILHHEMANKDDDAYYLLNGIKVEHPTHGIYIHRGKKVVFH